MRPSGRTSATAGASRPWTRDGSTADVDSGAWQGIASIAGVENLTGSPYDDDLAGDAGDNRIDGRGGNDKISGRDGDDTIAYSGGRDVIYGGAGRDTVDFSQAGEAVWTRLAYGGAYEAWTRGGDGDLDGGTWHSIASIAGVENLTGSPYDDDLAGDGNDNRLEGQAGADRLDGGDGEDVFAFETGAGDDTIVGWQDGLDMLDLTAFNYASFDAVADNATTIDSDLELSLGTDASVEIVGLSKSNFDDSDVMI